MTGEASSKTHGFRVAAVAPPQLLSPETNATINAKEAAVNLNWKIEPSVTQYRIQISSNPDFVAPVKDFVTTGSSTRLAKPKTGDYYWRVRSEEPADRPRPWGAARKFVVENAEPAPRLTQPTRFAPARVTHPTKPRTSARTEPIPHRAKVKHPKAAPAKEANSAGVTATETNAEKPRLPASSLSVPTLLTPNDGAHARSVSGRISIVFAWSKVNGAESYALEVASDEGFAQILERRTTSERGSLFRQADFKGRVFWRVRAKSAEEYSAWSSVFHFDLR